MTGLLDTLADSAATYARRALEAYVGDQQPDFFLFGGIAVEQALKARLVRANPAFIAPRDPFLAAVTFVRAADDVSLIPLGTPSVGAVEAVKRVLVLDKDLTPDLAGVEELFKLRNGEAHLGLIDDTTTRRTIVSFLRAINALLRIEPDRFWSPHHELVKTILDEDSAEVARTVAAKLAAAQMHYEQRVRLLSKEEATMLSAVVEAEVKRRSGPDAIAIICPACAAPVLLEGENTLDWEPEYDQDGVSGASPWVKFSGGNLLCETCDLELDGDEQLEAAGIEWQMQNDHADLEEWLSDYYAEVVDRG